MRIYGDIADRAATQASSFLGSDDAVRTILALLNFIQVDFRIALRKWPREVCKTGSSQTVKSNGIL